MTGRELILYILQNGLEDELIYEDGRLLGFLNIMEAAVKYDVGTATINVWVDNGYLDGIKIGNQIYIPANAKDPRVKEA